MLSRVWRDYIRRVLDCQLDLLDHTQLHTITVYTFLQLTTALFLFTVRRDSGRAEAHQPRGDRRRHAPDTGECTVMTLRGDSRVTVAVCTTVFPCVLLEIHESLVSK
jgi:hypothetical protein